MLQTPEEHIARLIFLHLQGIADEVQEQELSEWRMASPSHEEAYLRMIRKEYWEHSFRRFVKKEEDHLRGWDRLNRNIVKSQRRLRIRKWSYAAAVVLLLGIGGLLFYTAGNSLSPEPQELMADMPKPQAHTILTLGDGTEIDLKDEMARLSLSQRREAPAVGEGSLSYQNDADSSKAYEFHTLTVPRGADYILVLADGTEVYLNAESKLTFPVCFCEKERRVFLEGEAYFKVKKNSGQPFIVDVKPLEVEVTGTTFGIRAYQDESDVLTTLETGRVSVRSQNTSVDLTPDKQAVYVRETAMIKVQDVDVDVFLAWKDGRIIFDDCPLEEILTELGRWYDLDISYAREEIRSYRFSLNIRKHESYAEVFELLEAADQLRFEIDGNTIVVR